MAKQPNPDSIKFLVFLPVKSDTTNFILSDDTARWGYAMRIWKKSLQARPDQINNATSCIIDSVSNLRNQDTLYITEDLYNRIIQVVLAVALYDDQLIQLHMSQELLLSLQIIMRVIHLMDPHVRRDPDVRRILNSIAKARDTSNYGSDESYVFTTLGLNSNLGWNNGL